MRTQESAYARGFLHAYAGPILCMHSEFLKPKQGKSFCIYVEVWNESHILWESFQTPIFTL